MKKSLIFVGVIISYVIVVYYFNGKRFDKEKWDSYNICSSDKECFKKMYECKRKDMVNDLKTNYLAVGLPKAEVLQLLGKPAPSGVGDDFECIKYDLGNCSGLMKMDPDFLNICFDINFNVKSVSLNSG